MATKIIVRITPDVGRLSLSSFSQDAMIKSLVSSAAFIKVEFLG